MRRRFLQRLSLLFILGIFGASVASAQPFIFYRGIFNAGSFAPADLPNGAIARGSIFAIFGRDIGPATGVQVSEFPLATTFQDVEIKVCQDSECVNAIPLFVSAGQINAIMPSDAPLGPVSIQVCFNGEAGNFSPATVVERSVGIFTVSAQGYGLGIVQNFNSATDQPLNSLAAAARRGQVVIAWATGLGPGLNADNVPPQVGDLPVNVEVFVGGARVTNKLYSGRSAQFAGTDQIIFEIPADAPTGCWVPIQVRVDGRIVSNTVTIAIADADTPCSDPRNPFGAVFRDGGKLGALLAQKIEVSADVDPIPPFIDGSEWAAVALREEAGGPSSFNPVFSWPPVGSCVTYGVRADYLRDLDLPFPSPSVRGLDGGGSVTVSAGTSEREMQSDPALSGYYESRITTGFAPEDSFIADAATIDLTSAGGADVGALAAAIPISPAPVWSNRDQVRTITPNRDFTMRWEPPGGDGQLVGIGGGAVNFTGNATAIFACLADASAGQFTVPGWATAHLPQITPRLWEVDAMVGLGMGPSAGSGALQGQGLDVGIGLFSSWVVNGVAILEGSQ